MFLQPLKSMCYLGLLAILSLPIRAEQSPIEQHADETLRKLYHRLQSKPRADMLTRTTTISGLFIGRKYLLGSLGEGNNSFYDQSPLYRTDAFDCETYVDTVLAIALAKDPETFKQRINQIRYRNGHVSYIDRNHFTCLDWNKNNQQQGFVKDITTTLRDNKNQPIAKFARALIDKPAWYQHFTIQQLRINKKSFIAKEKRLQSLKQQGATLAATISTIPYIPLSALFDKSGQANMALFHQIPNTAIIEIIRPNWDLSKEIGTHLNVSHLGFAIWDKGTLFFREASSIHGKIVDVPFIDYLRDALKSPTIKGINIQIIAPEQPLEKI